MEHMVSMCPGEDAARPVHTGLLHRAHFCLQVDVT